jgi:hypothetical protein
MHHYWCQNFYITTASSERILDTLEFSPHNSPMPQISSSDRILMAAQDIKDALKHPHPDVPFGTIGDDTIASLATLSEISTKNFTTPETNNVPPSPQTIASYTRQRSELQPVITSPIKHYHQPRSQTKSNRTF